MKRMQDPFPPTPAGFHLRVEQTLCELEEKEMTRGKFSLSLVVALALILITATAVATSAVLSGGYVDAHGEYHPYTDPSQVPTMPEPQPYNEYRRLFESMPSGEIWYLEKDGEILPGASYMSDWKFYAEDTDIAALMEDSPLPLPKLPEGAEIWVLGTTADVEKEPYKVSTLPDGAVMKKYRLIEPKGEDITSYSVHILMDGNPSAIFLDMSIITPYTDDANTYLGGHVRGGGDYRSMMIEGWESALYIDDGDIDRSITCWKPYEGGKIIHCTCIFAANINPETAAAMLGDTWTLPEHESERNTLLARESEIISSLMREMPDGEYWRADRSYPKGAFISISSYEKYASLSAIQNRIASLNLPQPRLPEGYAETECQLHVLPEETPYEEITLETGAVLKKFRLNQDAPCGYSSTIVKDTDSISISVTLEDGNIPANDLLTGKEIDVYGYDRASWHDSGILTLLKVREDGWLRIEIIAPETIPMTMLMNIF